MAASFCYSHLLPLLFSFFFCFSHFATSLHIQKTGFGSSDPDILYLGSAASQVGAVNFNIQGYTCQVGWAIYPRRVKLWDSSSGRVTDFTSHYTFNIDNSGLTTYGHGICFFLAPFGFEIPPNSAGGFMGLFNTTTALSSQGQIVHVEFDSYPNTEWGETMEHVGINNHSVVSLVSTYWNSSLHSGDTADVWVTYNSTTKNLSVSWNYQRTSSPRENSSLSYPIDLTKALPEWVTVGFSAATGKYRERNILLSWEFSSTLDDIEYNEKKTKLVVILIVSGSIVLIVGGATVAYVLIRSRKKMRSKKEEGMNLTSMNDDLERGAGPRKFSYKELAKATNNFSEDRKLGQGGFGIVYKGYFADIDLTIAVKKISRGSRQGKREYVAEVKIISQLRHKNLVQLIGWCHEKGEFLLVYEFMPKGSLDAYLLGKKPPLPWKVRREIALGLASGLLYLHAEWQQCVIHRDIKSSNVMLDSSFNAKLGDFGLAKLVDHELGSQTTRLAGTMGYMAPEYMNTGRANKESDVYSFGVVVLEIATGRRANDLIMNNGDEEKGLIEWVWDYYGRGELTLAMDEKLQSDYNEREVECLMIVGLWCAHPDKSLRPSIRQAIQVLCSDEAKMPSLPSRKPVPTYLLPTPNVVSGTATLSSATLETGR